MSYSLPETGSRKIWYPNCISDVSETGTGTNFLVPVLVPISGVSWALRC